MVNNYKIRWTIIGGLIWSIIMLLTLFIELYLHDLEYYTPHTHATLLSPSAAYSLSFLIPELFEFQRVLIVVIGTITGLVSGFFYGKFKEKDMNRAAYIRKLTKEFLHDTRNHLGIIIGYSSLLNDFDCPIGMCGKDKDLPRVLEHANRLSLLNKETMLLITDFETGELKKQQEKEIKIRTIKSEDEII